MKNYIPSKSSVAKNAKLEAPVRLCGACTVRDYSEIGQFTFVNDGTTFFRNTTVGRYCSIGKACEIGAPMHPVDYAIVGGTPAKLIRYRFDEETVARLLATQWWTLTPEEIAKLNLTDVAKSLDLLEAAGRT